MITSIIIIIIIIIIIRRLDVAVHEALAVQVLDGLRDFQGGGEGGRKVGTLNYPVGRWGGRGVGG